MSAHLPPPPLTLTYLRLTYTLKEPMVLPRWKGALLRGGLGQALKKSFCSPDCQTVSSCQYQSDCAYATLFAPEADLVQPTFAGMRDAPRPYAIRPPMEDKRVYAADDHLTFELVLVGLASEYLAQVLLAFEQLGQLGLGKERGKARLLHVETGNPLTGMWHMLVEDGILRNHLTLIDGESIVAAAVNSGLTHPAPLTLHFLTPTRLKHNGTFVQIPECHMVIRAALRRISQLSTCYGDGPWEVPFIDLIRRAEAVHIRHSHIHWVDWSRTSEQSGRHMTLGGFVGSVTYEPLSADLRAILLAGSLVHIGKATVFGHGAYALATPPGTGG